MYMPAGEILSGTFNPRLRAWGPGTGLGSITTVVWNFPQGRIPRFRDVERVLISAICAIVARVYKDCSNKESTRSR